MKGTIAYEWKHIADLDINDIPEDDDYLCIVGLALDLTEKWIFDTKRQFLENIEDLCLEQYAIIPWPELPKE